MRRSIFKHLKPCSVVFKMTSSKTAAIKAVWYAFILMKSFPVCSIKAEVSKGWRTRLLLCSRTRQQTIVQTLFFPPLPSVFRLNLLPTSLVASLIFWTSSTFFCCLSTSISAPRLPSTAPYVPYVCPLSCHISPLAEALSCFPLIVWLAVVSPSRSTTFPLCEPSLYDPTGTHYPWTGLLELASIVTRFS